MKPRSSSRAEPAQDDDRPIPPPSPTEPLTAERDEDGSPFLFFETTKRAPPTERGVVFLSSIPTNMRPTEVRLHLQQMGEIFRTKFIPFPKKQKPGGRPGDLLPLQFKCGYVEFLSKKDAQKAVELLNGQPVLTKKRRKSYGQLWCLRYMEGFTWGSLAEEREEKSRWRRTLEKSTMDRERAANEAFRQMVLKKKEMDAAAARSNKSDGSGGAVKDVKKSSKQEQEGNGRAQVVSEGRKEESTKKKSSKRSVPSEEGAKKRRRDDDDVEDVAPAPPKKAKRLRREAA